MLKSKLLAFVFIAASFAATAQENNFSYESPKKYLIKEISVSGLKFLDSGVLISVSGIAAGDSILIPGDAITNALKKLWNQGLFSDVKISASKIDGSDVYLDIFLQEQPRISSFNFKGVRKGEVDDLKEKIKLRAGGQITESILENSITIIKKHYRAKGFLNVEVDAIQENDTVIANGVKLTFDIHKNGKVKIGKIDFEGNTAYSDAKLRRALKKIHRRDLNIFKSAKFIEADYEESKENLISFYNEHGYRDSKILKDSIYNISRKRIGIKFSVHEGPQYYIRNITWIGNTKLPAEGLSTFLGMKKGDVYDRSLLEKRLFIDENSISTLYMDDGYLFFQLDPVETNIQNDSVDIEMRIYEGDQATINNVFIAGNTKTNEHVIRREIWTKPGYLFSKSEITRTIRELAQMGHFDPEKMDCKPINLNPAEKKVDLRYILEEKANDQLEVSGGWGNKMFVGTIGIRFSNFSVRRIFEKKAWRPVPSGDSQSLALRASTNGTYYKSISLSFSEPWLGGKRPTNFSFSIYHQIQSGSTYFYQTSDKFFKVTGASVGLGTRLKWPDDYFTINNEVSYQNYYLKNWTGYFLFSNGQSNNLSFKTTFARNSTDQIIYPRTGSNLSLSLQLTPPYSLINGRDYTSMSDNQKYKWIEYHKWSGKMQWYLALVENLVVYSNFQFGFLGYYNADIKHSPFEGFSLGGDGMSGYNLYGQETIGLRGYQNSSLTPYDKNGIGAGHIYDKYTVELRYPITLKPQAAIYVLSFVEAGNAWETFDEFNPFNVHRSAGVGARMFLPMLGMLGIDWAYGFDKVPYKNVHKGQFHFVIGMPF